jgi:uncharacterized membrane protein
MEKPNITEHKEKQFAVGLSFYKLTWCFILVSILGTYYEEIITLFKHGVWENRSAVILGPFNPLYGTASVVAILLFSRMRNPIKVILYGALFGGLFEYGANWAQEYFTGSVSWNYTDLMFNINGRTTVIYSLFWGFLIYILVIVCYPYVSRWIESVPYKPGVIVTNVFIVFLTINMLVTYSMLIRQGMREKGIEAYTPIGEYYDEIFTDEYIAELFPNMHLQEGEEDE